MELGVREDTGRAFAGRDGGEGVTFAPEQLDGVGDSCQLVIGRDEARPQDAAVSAAWRSRMELRRRIYRDIFRRIRDPDALAPAWTVDTAADVLHSMMLPVAWRELIDQVGWTAEECPAHLTTAVQRVLLNLSS